MIEVDVQDLLEKPGESRRVKRAEPLLEIQLELAEVPEDAHVQIDLLVESVADGVLVSGRLSAPARLACARCLTAIEDQVEVEVRELFVSDPGDDEYEIAEAGVVDLEPMVRDALVPALPFAPLCKPDCLGLCVRCGGDHNLGECSCTEPAIDPRWAALEGLAEQLEARQLLAGQDHREKSQG